MKLEVGKFYKTRGGQRVGPILVHHGSWGDAFHWSGSKNAYLRDGSCVSARDAGDEQPVGEWLDSTACANPYHKEPTKRAQILDTAKQYVTKDRNATHGEPEDTFSAISGMWSAYLGVDVEPHDVCAMMALLKVGRIKANPGNDDNWIDLAGYAACGAEVAK